jgi:hypothetical protein
MMLVPLLIKGSWAVQAAHVVLGAVPMVPMDVGVVAIADGAAKFVVVVLRDDTEFLRSDDEEYVVDMEDACCSAAGYFDGCMGIGEVDMLLSLLHRSFSFRVGEFECIVWVQYTTQGPCTSQKCSRATRAFIFVLVSM